MRTDTGIKVRVNGSNGVSGGTSAVAPKWAALTAVLSQLLGKKAGFFIPLLYANAKAPATNDIVTGNNSVFGVAGFFGQAWLGRVHRSGLPEWRRVACTVVQLYFLHLSDYDRYDAAHQRGGSTTGVRNHGRPQIAANNLSIPRQRYCMASSYRRPIRCIALIRVISRHANLRISPRGTVLPRGSRCRFIIGTTGPTFYGFIAQSASDPSRFVLAIRGNSSGVEWWDDSMQF